MHTYGESDASRAKQITPQLIFGDPISYHLSFDIRDINLDISLSDFISELIAAIHLLFMRFSAINSDWSLKLYYPQNLKV